MRYLDAVIPVMDVELLENYSVDQIVHPNFEHNYELLRFQEGHEVSYILLSKFSRKP